jgi:hypothetical protein
MSVPFLTLPDVCRVAFSCDVPTLLSGSCVAAYPTPPSIMKSARLATTFA